MDVDQMVILCLMTRRRINLVRLIIGFIREDMLLCPMACFSLEYLSRLNCLWMGIELTTRDPHHLENLLYFRIEILTSRKGEREEEEEEERCCYSYCYFGA